ncbi:NUMOD3 domain-containing DNA-binding protein [Alkalihalophilus pseudofirmus]|uniref:NUMOD3 domain-containing DNA-binding protein n=1 Tax=Alkalihalophilus pseudofirmus TaxID=79885 RepID=UPI00259B7D34|nr:NUMOD3 domain-containing DNA-binding protein [Alkalihalophilus pseudofirmus]WEG19062.1 NUMOD3 domain-containing DNA-binding protein [Alkalihalophilus pseudofirmus]
MVESVGGCIFEAYGFIYVTTNINNGKRYVGSKVFSYPSGKKTNWESYLGSGKALKSAINKHGRESFYKEIIYIANSVEELEQMETYYILLFNAAVSKDWYNIKEGSNLSGSSIKGKTDVEIKLLKNKLSTANKIKWKSKSEEEKVRWKENISRGHSTRSTEDKEITKIKLRVTLNNKTPQEKLNTINKRILTYEQKTEEEKEIFSTKVSKEVKKIWEKRTPEQVKLIADKISHSNKLAYENLSEEDKDNRRRVVSARTKGSKNGFYGKTHSEETRKRMREKKMGDKSPKAKKVYLYDPNGKLLKEFSTLKEASTYLVEKEYVNKVNGGKSAIKRSIERGCPVFGIQFSFGGFDYVGENYLIANPKKKTDKKQNVTIHDKREDVKYEFTTIDEAVESLKDYEATYPKIYKRANTGKLFAGRFEILFSKT